MTKLINMRLTFIIMLLFAVYNFPQADILQIKQYNTDNGLSQNQIFCIYKDSRGLMWFGTQNGLNMFDGYSFRVFNHEPGNPNSIIDYAVNAVCEYPEGIFWIGTREGLTRFDFRYGTYKHYRRDISVGNSLPDNTVWSLAADKKGNLWIATGNGLSRFNISENRFYNYKSEKGNENSLSHNFVTEILIDSEEIIWIGSRGGIDIYNPSGDSFIRNKITPEDPDNIFTNGVISLEEYSGKIFAGTYDGIFAAKNEINNGKKLQFHEVYRAAGSRTSVRDISKGSGGILWFATTDKGIFGYSVLTGNITNYRSTLDEKSLSEDNTTAIFEDDNQVLWIGTYNSGINKHVRSSENFIAFRLPPGIKQNRNEKVTSVMKANDGYLWLGTESGKLLRVSPLLKKENVAVLKNPVIKDKILSREINSLLTDKSGIIWFTTFGSGLFRFDPLKNILTNFRNESGDSASLSNDFTHTVFQSSDGSIWVGTGAGGLNRYNPETGKFIVFKHDPANPQSIPSNEITVITEDEEKNLWLGTPTKGLVKFNPSENIFSSFNHKADDIKSLSASRILSIHIDRKGVMWIGTFGGGLNRFDKSSGLFTHFTERHGLPGNIINSIIEDNKGNLWLSTDKGISGFNPDENSFRNFNIDDGVHSNQFSKNAALFDEQTGLLYFAGMNGFTAFNPSVLLQKKSTAGILFTDLKIINLEEYYREGENKNVIYADELILSYDNNIISFEFASLDFSNPDKNNYAYKLEGFNEDWIHIGNQRLITFTNLDAGSYNLRIKGTNSEGIWNEEGIALKVVILPPWWQTWWAYSLYGIFIVVILYSLRQYEMKRVKLRNDLKLKDFEAKKLQEVDQLKSHFYANISHEFRTPLTLILGLIQKFESRTNDKMNLNDYGVMKRNANRLLQLINQLLELSKIEAGKAELSASEQDIVSFVKRILASFASYAGQKNIRLLFNGKDLNHTTTDVLKVYYDKDKMEKIVSNLISNAVKYTPDGNEIELKTGINNDYAEIKVINSGVTISRADLLHIFDRFFKADRSEHRIADSTGIGLALVKELVEMHKGTIAVTSEYDVTEFIVRIPLGRAHLSDTEIVSDVSVDEDSLVLPYTETEYDGFDMKAEEINIPVSKEDMDVILIVEDHNDLRKYIKETLESIYVVHEAENGRNGLEAAKEIVPDLIISDIMMPEMDGYSFCKKIKSDDKTDHIPVILLTAKASVEDKLEGLELGADDYLIKPFNPDELRLRVRNLIKIREQLRQKFTSEMVLKPAEIVVPSAQVQFVEKLKFIIEQNLEDENFGVDKLSAEMGMSRSQLHRKLKAVTNQSTTEFIRNFRLHRAAQLIKQEAGTMSEIAYMVGFNSQAYFNKAFQDLFGCSPTEYKRSNS